MAIFIECKECRTQQPVIFSDLKGVFKPTGKDKGLPVKTRGRCRYCGVSLHNQQRNRQARMISIRQVSGKKVRTYLGYLTRLEALEKDQDQGKKARTGDLVKEVNERSLTFFDLCDWYLCDNETIRGKRGKRYGIKPWDGKKHRSKLPWSVIKKVGEPLRPSWKREANHLKLLCEYKINGNGKTIGDLKVLEITLDLLEKWKDSLYDKKLSDDTIHDKIAILHAMARKAKKRKRISPDTCETWESLDTVAKQTPEAMDADVDPRLIKPSEYVTLLKKARSTEKWNHLAPVMVILYNTGMRPKELTRLRWEHINFEKKEITLPGEITKTGKQRWVPMNEYVKQELESLPRHIDCDYVITYNEKPLTRGAESFKRAFRELRNEVKLRDMVKIKFFRHTFITLMDASGVNPTYRKMIAGHSLPGMDANYILQMKPFLHDAIARFTRAIYGEPEGEDRVPERIKNAYTLLPAPKQAQVTQGVQKSVQNIRLNETSISITN